MTPLESLALLIADLNTQVRALQQENAELRAQQAEPAAGKLAVDQVGPTIIPADMRPTMD